MTSERFRSCDVAIVGAGAAGLATAIFTRRLHPRISVVLLDGAARLGAKILVSGGSRCNVTNATVTDADFWGGRRSVVRRVLRAFPVRDTVAFFREIGVSLHEEADGKLFPDSNRARDVLNALLREAARVGVDVVAGTRVHGIERTADDRLCLRTNSGDVSAAQAVLATGGRSLPKSGSDGLGYDIARRLGHRIVPTTPGLVPLTLDATAMHRDVMGVAHDAELTLWIENRINIRLRGSLLWTHFGISGPVTLDMSRHWLRASLENTQPQLTVNFCPGRTFEDVESWWTTKSAERPHSTVAAQLATLVPASVAAALLARIHVGGSTSLAHFTREDRRSLSHALTRTALPVTGDRGYNYAEVTAGGVSLDEIDPATMKSRVCAGLSLVGEILDVDGRIGGFNFQWAWSSARVAAAALGT